LRARHSHRGRDRQAAVQRVLQPLAPPISTASANGPAAPGSPAGVPSGAAVRTGVLLVNLGTPDEPTPAGVRRYLREFLSATRGVGLRRLLWLPLLHGIVLNPRPKASARKYAAIWTDEGSPLRVHTERQAKLLEGYLSRQVRSSFSVAWAMRYGQPS